MSDAEIDGRVHAQVMASFVDHGAPPTAAQLAASLDLEPDVIAGSLRRLHAGHGLVLHPDSLAIWIAHPFSSSPTSVCVTADDRTWWAPCMWCAAGVLSLIEPTPGGPHALVHARWRGEHEPLVLGADAAIDPLIHFAMPPRDAWSNVVHWCATVQPFKSAADVDEWCERHALPRGEAVPWSQVRALGRAWYDESHYLSPTWRKWTTRQASAIFESVGLRSPFWLLPESDETF